jgi:predicted nucleic acid-binding protein
MVLVDTSIWIRFLFGVAPIVARIDELLNVEQIAGHDSIYGELLIGDVGGRSNFLARYERMWQAPVLAHRDVLEFVLTRRLHGRGLSWIDAQILASAHTAGIPVWAADVRFAEIARELGVGYAL